jgi:aspartate aminotransferase
MPQISENAQDIAAQAFTAHHHLERLSQRSESLSPTPIELKSIVMNQRKAGRLVYNFGLPENLGFPSLSSSSEEDFNEMFARVEDKEPLSFEQHHPCGALALRQAILDWSEAEEVYHPENVIVSSSANQSILQALLAICDPGDSIILPAVPRESYLELIRMSGCNPEHVKPSSISPTAKIDRDSLLKLLADSEQTRAVLLCNPCNPTGEFYTAEEIREILDLCADYGVYLLLDRRLWRTIPTEVRNATVLSSKTHVPWLVHIDSISGDFECADGLRIAWSIGPSDVSERIASLHKHSGSSAATLSQLQAIRMLNAADNKAEDIRAEFLLKRALWEKHSNGIPLVKIFPTHAGVFSYWDISRALGRVSPQGRRLLNADDVSEYLLENFSVISTPGSAFQPKDAQDARQQLTLDSTSDRVPAYLRFSFGTRKESIVEGLAEVRKAFESLK